jgi:adenosine kinase
MLMASAGQDFGEYRSWLESAGVDTSLVLQVPDKFTASFFCSTDLHNNQIASFYTGAMANSGELSFRNVKDCGWAIVSPNDPGAMVQYADECRTLGIQYIFDPGQQCTRMSGDELREGMVGATIVICNDYEFELVRQKTGLDESAILERSEALIVTRGENGSSVMTRAGRTDIAAVTPTRVIDPTGVGDAFRGGLLKGIALGLPYHTAAQLGSVAATYALEHLGGQSHAYTWGEFAERYEAHFGALSVA